MNEWWWKKTWYTLIVINVIIVWGLHFFIFVSATWRRKQMWVYWTDLNTAPIDLYATIPKHCALTLQVSSWPDHYTKGPQIMVIYTITLFNHMLYCDTVFHQKLRNWNLTLHYIFDKILHWGIFPHDILFYGTYVFYRKVDYDTFLWRPPFKAL